MSLLGLIGLLIIVGVLIWAAQRVLAVLPVAEPFKTVIYVLIVVFAVFFILNAFGLLGGGFGFGGPALGCLHIRC